ncbi:MAG: replication-associated recombination protein A, partial [Candidatus Acidiferrales bacterium]
YAQVKEDVERTLAEPVPLHLRNPVTRLMKEFGYGRGYQYAHNHEDRTTSIPCLPESLRNRRYYLPTAEGYEEKLKTRLRELEALRTKKK